MKIKKGDKFLCIEHVIMNDGNSDEVAYISGKEYTVESSDNRIKVNIPSEIYKKHNWDIDDPDFINYFELVTEVKDPINKAWHDKFATPISEMKDIPAMNPEKFIKSETFTNGTEPESIKPDYYKFNIKGVDCDMFDIAESLQLPIRLFSALKYFRVKGDKAKQINDLEKAIECIKLEIERIKR